MMPWVKLDTGIFRNPKIVTIGADAKLLYIAGICYAGDNLTDGLIPANAVTILGAEANVRNTKRATNDLIAAGLWVAIDGGFDVHDYLDHNSRSQDVQSKREAAKDRMQRARSQDVRANFSRTDDEQNAKFAKSSPSIEGRRKKEETEADTDPPIPPEGDEGVEDDVPKKSKLDERFDRWWAVYPSKVGKGGARKAWERLKPDDALTGVMIDAVEAQKATLRWFRDDGRYIPNPATWLNQERWLDELDVTAPEECNDSYIAAFGDDNVRRMAEWLDALNGTFGGVGWVRSSLRKLAVEVPGLTPEQLKTGLTTGFGRAETSLKAEDARIANPPALVHAMFRDALREQREVAA